MELQENLWYSLHYYASTVKDEMKIITTFLIFCAKSLNLLWEEIAIKFDFYDVFNEV